MAKTKMQELADFGQSIWLDYINRSLLETGKLKSMITQGLQGMTSNPTIFDKAVSASNDYDTHIAAFKKKGKSTFEIYDDLTVKDIQEAADLFKSVYEKTHRVDGYVSLEVNPNLAYNVQETIEEAKRLHKKVNRPNVMFKVPSTYEGFSAIEELLALGININITLIFSLEQYKNTARAYIKGVERLLQNDGDASTVYSVASVFVSRVDTLTDKLINEKVVQERDTAKGARLESLKGTAAVANAAILYKNYRDIFSGEQFVRLKEKGANVQRLLWGSTSTKNPAYSDIKYVTELIGKHTINTLPEHTLRAFIDHGVVKEALTGDIAEAQKIIADLREWGIDIDDVCRKLIEDGVIAFEKSFDALLNAIEQKSKQL